MGPATLAWPTHSREHGPTVRNEATLCCGHTGGTTMGLQCVKVRHQLALHDVIVVLHALIASSCGESDCVGEEQAAPIIIISTF